MKKTKAEKEPKLQFNRGNPESPAPPGIDDDPELREKKENQISTAEINEGLKKGKRMKKNAPNK